MKTFNSQLELTAYFEGFKPDAYQDIGGVWTLGYGFTTWNRAAVTPGMKCTEIDASRELAKIISYLMNALASRFKMPEQPGMKTHMLEAIADYVYNVGINGCPKLSGYMISGDYTNAANEFLDGFYVNGTPVMGLFLRRISEYNTFVNGTYVAYEKGDLIPLEIKTGLLKMNDISILKRLNIVV